MKRMIVTFAALLGFAYPALAEDSAESDGAQAFFNLCGGTVAGTETPLDPLEFKFTKLGSRAFKDVRPSEDGPYWDVEARRSGLRALVHIWSNGNCSLEILKGDEAATRGAFEVSLRHFAEALGAQLERRPDKVKMVENLPMTSSEWEVSSSSARYLVGLTTYPEDRFMTQHIMLLRKLD